MKIEYPEIQTLLDLHQKHHIKIKVLKHEYLDGKEDFPSVVFSLGKKSFNLFIDDEYKDLLVDNRLVALCLVLRELEYYHDTKDFLAWTTELNLDAANSQVLEYYKNLAAIYREIESIIGPIKSPINDFDFEMNMGAIRELRTNYY